MPHTLFTKASFYISTDKRHLDTGSIYKFLSEQSYWAKDIPEEKILASIAGSALCFGLFTDNPSCCRTKQIGFARVITDLARFAYICDVFIVPAYRGQGLGKWLMETIVGHESLKSVTRIMLATHDAHGLYAKYGFTPLTKPQNYMELHRN